MAPSADAAPDRRYASGRATRGRIMVLAERLLAQRGLEAVSREIGVKAGQRIDNVVQYHFGDRARLVGAITRSGASTSTGVVPC